MSILWSCSQEPSPCTCACTQPPPPASCARCWQSAPAAAQVLPRRWRRVCGGGCRHWRLMSWRRSPCGARGTGAAWQTPCSACTGCGPRLPVAGIAKKGAGTLGWLPGARLPRFALPCHKPTLEAPLLHLHCRALQGSFTSWRRLRCRAWPPACRRCAERHQAGRRVMERRQPWAQHASATACLLHRSHPSPRRRRSWCVPGRASSSSSRPPRWHPTLRSCPRRRGAVAEDSARPPASPSTALYLCQQCAAGMMTGP